MRVVDADGNGVARYRYDPYGNLIYSTGSFVDTNPLRYRGYYFDQETGFYYLQSRYYDPEIGRFINADDFASTGQGILGHNMFAYCNNNPVARVDADGAAFETVFDIVSLGFSVAEVVANPYDPWAWAGLLGDVIDVAIPCVGGIGEAIDAAKTTVRVIQGADDVVDAAKTFRRTADAADDVKKATGAYVVLYENGQHYVGKGGFKRAIKSAKEHMTDNNKVASIIWAPTTSGDSAFVTEFLLQSVYGVGKDVTENFNQIWSPGKKLLQALQSVK